MGQEYLLDSNVIIGYLAGKIPASGMKILSEIIDKVPNISDFKKIPDLVLLDPWDIST